MLSRTIPPFYYCMYCTGGIYILTNITPINDINCNYAAQLTVMSSLFVISSLICNPETSLKCLLFQFMHAINFMSGLLSN